MSKEEHSIHEFDLDLICEYFSQFDRQGPGSPDITIKALSFIDGLTSGSRIADLGCGTGTQTCVLAQNAPGHVTGLDLFSRFIDKLNASSNKLGLQQRLEGKVGSMDDLPFQDEELDLIWSEGAIYNIGFERGLREWKSYLKPGGYVAVSEASWFSDQRPAEIEAYWNQEYPGIETVPKKLQQLQDAGYTPIACFQLPKSCWIDHFYAPQVPLQDSFLLKHKGNVPARQFIEHQRREAQLYRQYGSYYGYAFYIGQKPGS